MTKLILDINDVKSHVAIDFIAGFDVLEPFILDNEKWLIRKYTGKALFEKLVSTKNTPAETPDIYAELLAIAQGIVINRSMMQYIPEGQLDISENGIRINTTDTKKTAFEWQIVKLEKRYLYTTHEKIEELLDLLFNNDVTEWKSSSIFKNIRANFVNAAYQFNKYFNIDESHQLFLSLVPDIEYAERVYILSALGEVFFNELKVKILAGEDVLPTNPDASKTAHFELFRLIRAAVVYLTVLHATSDLKKPEDIELRCVHAQQQLKSFVDEKASNDLFNSYFTSSKYTSPEIISTLNSGIDNSVLTGIYGAF
jgi:hypothetical protein